MHEDASLSFVEIKLGAFFVDRQGGLAECRQFLRDSLELRLGAIQTKLALALTFCASVEIQIRFGHFGRAKDFLQKLRVAVNGLTAHINDPMHVSDTRAKQEFRKQLAHLVQRVSALDTQIKQGSSAVARIDRTEVTERSIEMPSRSAWVE